MNGPVGTYDHRITFSLADFNAASASITGQWAADDTGTDILVNGVSTGDTTMATYRGFTAFSLTSGFVDGVNTLDFIVDDTGGPTGLRVEMTGTVDAPEPAAIALLGAGVFSLGLIRRRRSA